MTTDVPPMDACPFAKDGAHRITYLIPSDDDQDLTLVCHRCGSMRRVPATGAIPIPADYVQVLWSRE